MWSLGGCAHPPRLKEKCHFPPVRTGCVIPDRLTEAAGGLRPPRGSPGLVLDKLSAASYDAYIEGVFFGGGSCAFILKH